jgi:hypothetical protein
MDVAEELDEATTGGSRDNPSGGTAKAAVPIGVKSGVFCKEDVVDPYDSIDPLRLLPRMDGLLKGPKLGLLVIPLPEEFCLLLLIVRHNSGSSLRNNS